MCKLHLNINVKNGFFAGGGRRVFPKTSGVQPFCSGLDKTINYCLETKNSTLAIKKCISKHKLSAKPRASRKLM